MKTPKRGRPKTYQQRLTIQHSIESDVLAKVDKIATLAKTRTDLINEFIKKGLTS